MRVSKLLPWYVTPIVIGVSAAGLAGCAGLSNLHIVGCSGGKCGTANVSTAQPSTQPPMRVTTTAPAPASTVTVTSTPSTDPSVVVEGCSVYLTHAEMYLLATSLQARDNLAECMQIPQDQIADFANQVAVYALQSLNSGDYGMFPQKLDSIYHQYQR